MADTELDVRLENAGGLFIVQPMTAAAREWIDANVQDDATWWAGGLVVEPGYIVTLLQGMTEGGITWT
jgi:hypothetical protein